MKNFIIAYRRAAIALLMILLHGVGASASTPWEVNPSDYRYDMSLYLDVSFAATKMDYSRYDVGAFVGDECRGVAERLPLAGGSECLYLRARSNSANGETMTFKYRNRETGEVQPIDGVTFQFESDGRMGYPSEPFAVKIVRHYDVTLSAEGGGTLSHEGGRIAEGTALSVTATPAEGHRFVQWSDGTTDNPKEIVVDRDITLSAQFAVNSYKLTYQVDGETYKETEVNYGTAIQPEAYPEKEGHTFSGWQGLPETMPAHDVEVTGQFTVNSYRLTYTLDGETYKELEVPYGTAVVPEANPEKEGHTFSGWQGLPETMPARDVEVTGQFTVNSYKLTYTVDGETYKELDVPYGTAIQPEAYPEKEGHTFSGWEGLPETMPAHDVTASGSFAVNSYEAVFTADGQEVARLTVVYGQTVTPPDAPEKEGHTFAGWQNLPETMPAHDIEVTAAYNVNSYRLTWYLNGEIYREESVEYGAAISVIEPEVPEGMVFDGWQDEIPATMPAHDVDIHGTYSKANGIRAIMIEEDTRVSIYSLSGHLVCKDMPWREAKGKLRPGLYVINGAKRWVGK